MGDPLAEALGNIDGGKTGGRPYRIVQLYGDRPLVLDKIKELRRRGVSAERIAAELTKLGDGFVSPGGVRSWLLSEGEW